MAKQSPSCSGKVDGRPSFQWYPQDWLAEPGLRVCSLAARGMWIDCICLMWRSPERGVLLKANGTKPEAGELARLLGITEAEAKQTLAELAVEGVSATREDGTIYSRRMVRDETLRRSKVEAGRKGGLARTRPVTEKQSGSTPSRAPAHASSSSSSSSSVQRPDDPSGSSPQSSAPPEPELICPPDLADLELYADPQQNGVTRRQVGILKLWGHWTSLKTGWTEAYPAVDVLAEVRRAHAWELSNPAKRKVDRVKFLGSWLARQQQRGNPASGEQGGPMF